MKKFLITCGLALLLLSIESVLVHQLGLEMSRIDVTVVLIAFLSLRAGTVEGATSSFGVGYLLDLMSGQPTGLFTFLGVFTFLLGRLLAGFVDVRGRQGFVLFAMGADIAHGLLAAFFTWLTTREGVAAVVLPAMPLQVALTGGAALALWPLLRNIEMAQERTQTGLLR